MEDARFFNQQANWCYQLALQCFDLATAHKLNLGNELTAKVRELRSQEFAEYGSLSGEKDTIDVDEIITALAKTVAEMTFGSDDALRRRILEDLMREISQFEEEFANAPASDVRH
jgi:hypothetical protein